MRAGDSFAIAGRRSMSEGPGARKRRTHETAAHWKGRRDATESGGTLRAVRLRAHGRCGACQGRHVHRRGRSHRRLFGLRLGDHGNRPIPAVTRQHSPHGPARHRIAGFREQDRNTRERLVARRGCRRRTPNASLRGACLLLVACRLLFRSDRGVAFGLGLLTDRLSSIRFANAAFSHHRGRNRTRELAQTDRRTLPHGHTHTFRGGLPPRDT